MIRRIVWWVVGAWVVFIGVTGGVFADDAPSCIVGDDCEEATLGVSSADIAAYPTPDVMRLAPQDNVIFDRRYRRVMQAVDLYDAPNGAIVDRLEAGFNFVTTGEEQDGWTRTSSGKWLRSEFLGTNVQTSRYSGVFLPFAPLPYPMAWVLVNVNPALTPGGEFTSQNPLLQRYTTVNIFSAIEVDGWEWYQVGDGQWVKQTQVAIVKPIERPADVTTQRWVSVDLYEQVLIAYEDETPVFATLISSGLEQWPTNEGSFEVYVRYGRSVMAGAYGKPDFYYLQEVPWSMYFDNDIALHGAYWHDGFGYRRSHGCVNLSIMDSRWLYEWASPEFDTTIPNDTGLGVHVYSSGVYR
jgi:hypothetical protein